MFVLKVKTENKRTTTSAVHITVNEFEIMPVEDIHNTITISLDDKWFCKTLLNNYDVNKLRCILKTKFNAIKYNDKIGTRIYYYNGSHFLLKPMVFKTKEDADAALEWIQSVQIIGKL